MTTTVTVGKRGTLVLPKRIRDKCKIDEGSKLDIVMDDNVIVIMPSTQTRTRLDENFDKARELLLSNGVTLEMALAELTRIKHTDERLV